MSSYARIAQIRLFAGVALRVAGQAGTNARQRTGPVVPGIAEAALGFSGTCIGRHTGTAEVGPCARRALAKAGSACIAVGQWCISKVPGIADTLA